MPITGRMLGVDLNAVGGELLAVVDQSMQPTQASLWPRPHGSPEVGRGALSR
jgi:hypothetical protein